MNEIESNFFEGKRAWSKLKDQVIKNYLPPYLKKVNRLNESIILVDTFAGPGKYEDGEIGSPIYICELANQYVPNKFLAVLANKNIEHHEKLKENIKEFIDAKKAFALRGKAEDLLQKMHGIISTQVLFIYLDPFGLLGTNFSLLEPYLSRSKKYSTELIINLSIPTILRLSCINSIAEKGETPQILAKQYTLTKVLGGEFWKSSLLDYQLSTEQRINKFLDAYKQKLMTYLPEVGYCPVYERTEHSKMKYAIFFASRHPDAKILMNNIMFNAYSEYIWKRNYSDTLFGELDWSDNLPSEFYDNLEEDILSLVNEAGISRIELWKNIVDKNFMKYDQKSFNKVLKKLIPNKLDYHDIRKTGKLNDESILYNKNVERK